MDCVQWCTEADDRTRTDNLLITNQLLCQLSHIGVPRTPMWRYEKIYDFRVEQSSMTRKHLTGAYRARTYDPLLVRQMLSQLS